jgi:hypothetical protein
VPTTLVPAAAAPTHIHSTAGDSAPATAGAALREVVCRGGRRRLSLSTRVKSWHSSAWMSQPTWDDQQPAGRSSQQRRRRGGAARRRPRPTGQAAWCLLPGTHTTAQTVRRAGSPTATAHDTGDDTLPCTRGSYSQRARAWSRWSDAQAAAWALWAACLQHV